MGTAVAQVLAQNGHHVWLWDYNPHTLEAIKTNKESPFLPGVKLSQRIKLETIMQTAVAKAGIVLIAASSPYVRTTVRHLSRCFEMRHGQTVVAHVAKGLEEKTFLTMHEVIQSELPADLYNLVVTISGPSIAKEFVNGVPTAVVAAGKNTIACKKIRDVFESDSLKVAISNDVKGVGICGALKNVYAIALGMCDGMRLTMNPIRGRSSKDDRTSLLGGPASNGMNAKAFMLTMALREMEEIAHAFGGKKETVYGLAGLGDMIVTGLGEGRNRALGERLCRGGSCEFVFKRRSAQTYEGVTATKVLFDLTRRKKVKAPLIEMINRVLYGGADPCKELKRFFAGIEFV